MLWRSVTTDRNVRTRARLAEHWHASERGLVNQQASLQLRDRGAIVNFSSSAVGLALPSYAASKRASDAITPVLARELNARDITVNAIAPALERPGAAADIANLVAFPSQRRRPLGQRAGDPGEWRHR